MVFYQHSSTFLIYPFVCINTGSLHLSVVRRDAPGREQKCNHMHRFRSMTDKVKHSFSILTICYRIRFKCMNKVREFQCVSYKKYLQIVSNQVPVSIFSVHFYSKAPRVSKCLW